LGKKGSQGKEREKNNNGRESEGEGTYRREGRRGGRKGEMWETQVTIWRIVEGRSWVQRQELRKLTKKPQRDDLVEENGGWPRPNEAGRGGGKNRGKEKKN